MVDRFDDILKRIKEQREERITKVREMAEELMTVEEAATALRVSTRTIRREIKRGAITAKKISGKWLITRREFDKYRPQGG